MASPHPQPPPPTQFQGGLPAWLLQKEGIILRSSDPGKLLQVSWENFESLASLYQEYLCFEGWGTSAQTLLKV